MENVYEVLKKEVQSVDWRYNRRGLMFFCIENYKRCDMETYQSINQLYIEGLIDE